MSDFLAHRLHVKSAVIGCIKKIFKNFIWPHIGVEMKTLSSVAVVKICVSDDLEMCHTDCQFFVVDFYGSYCRLFGKKCKNQFRCNKCKVEFGEATK
jgi:hypothetical protein